MYEALYSENKGLLQAIARRYAWACEYDRAVSVEDLVQAGFFGLISAAQGYNAGKGSWAHYAGWYIAREIYKALGFCNGRKKAHTGALSLDAPLVAGDPDGMTGLDALEDKSLPDPNDGIVLGQIAAFVRQAVERLESDQQRTVIKICALDGKPYEAAAEALGVSTERVRQIRQAALRSLRKDKTLRRNTREDIELRVPYYARVSVTAFQNTRTSVTEKAALWHMDHIERMEQQRQRLEQIEAALTERERLFKELSGKPGKGAAVC